LIAERVLTQEGLVGLQHGDLEPVSIPNGKNQLDFVPLVHTERSVHVHEVLEDARARPDVNVDVEPAVVVIWIL
jgi:hypothetical protein